jgi:hypothetical protein
VHLLDTREEQPEQQTTERLDVDNAVMAVARIGQEQAAEEGTDGHGRARPAREPRGIEHQ